MPQHRNRRMVISLIAVAVVTVFFRVYLIGSQPLWTDEANCLAIARGASGSVWEALHKDCSPPLYYWLLGLSVAHVGKPSEAETRALSAVFGIMFIPVITWAGYRFLGSRGLLCGVIAAVSPLHIWHSQEARMYSLIVLLGAFLIYLLVRIMEDDGSTGLFTGLVVVQLLLLWTHHFSLFPVVLSWIMIIAGTNRSISNIRPYVLVLIAGWLPVGWLAAVQSFAYRTGDWLPPPPADAIFRSLGLWICGVEAMDHSRVAGIPITLVFGGVGIALPAIYGLRSRVGKRCAIFVSGGLLFSYAVSLIRPAYTPGRYDVCFLPAFLIFLGAGLKNAPRYLRTCAILCILAAGLLGVHHYFVSYEKSAIRSMIGIIDIMSRDDDAIVVVPEIEVPVVRYYYAGPCSIIVPPAFGNMHTVDYRDYKSRWENRNRARILARITRGMISPGGRIFLIYSPYKGTVEFREQLLQSAGHSKRLMRAITGSGYTELLRIG